MNTTSQRLVLHADDLGMNRAVDEGIFRGFRHGLLTSTSALANAPDVVWALQQWKTLAAEQAAGQLPSADVRRRLDDPDGPFDLGIHLNLTQGRPLSSGFPTELLDKNGHFLGVFALFARLQCCGRPFHAAIRTELEQQVQVVCDHGLRPTHLNGHQYIEMIPAIARIVPNLLKQFGIKVVRVASECALWRTTVLAGQFWKWPLAHVKRLFAARFRVRMDVLGVAHPRVFFGTAHAGSVNLRLMQRFLASAKPYVDHTNQLVEVGLHPGETADLSSVDPTTGWHDPLAALRPLELAMLVDRELTTLMESSGWRLGRLSMIDDHTSQATIAGI